MFGFGDEETEVAVFRVMDPLRLADGDKSHFSPPYCRRFYGLFLTIRGRLVYGEPVTRFNQDFIGSQLATDGVFGQF